MPGSAGAGGRSKRASLPPLRTGALPPPGERARRAAGAGVARLPEPAVGSPLALRPVAGARVRGGRRAPPAEGRHSGGDRTGLSRRRGPGVGRPGAPGSAGAGGRSKRAKQAGEPAAAPNGRSSGSGRAGPTRRRRRSPSPSGTGCRISSGSTAGCWSASPGWTARSAGRRKALRGRPNRAEPPAGAGRRSAGGAGFRRGGRAKQTGEAGGRACRRSERAFFRLR